MRARLWPALVLVAVSLPVIGEERAQLMAHGVHAIGSPSALAGRCRVSDRKITGCTRFFGRSLTGKCEADGGRWKIIATARFYAMSYVLDGITLLHEHAHIDDIRRDIETHLTSIETQRFDSAEGCEGAAVTAAAAFENQMDAFQWTSNANRHRLQTSSKPPPAVAAGRARR